MLRVLETLRRISTADLLAAAVLGHDDAHCNIHYGSGLQGRLQVPRPVQVVVDPQRQPQAS